MSVILTDLNALKAINDQHGHVVGNRAVLALGSILRSNARREDLPCRYGGDEFAVVMPGAEFSAAEALRERLERACAGVSQQEIPGWQGAAFGVGTCPEDGTSAEVIISAADERAYERKRAHYELLKQQGRGEGLRTC